MWKVEGGFAAPLRKWRAPTRDAENLGEAEGRRQPRRRSAGPVFLIGRRLRNAFDVTVFSDIYENRPSSMEDRPQLAVGAFRSMEL